MDLEVDSLGDAPSLEWKKSARRRSSTGSRKVPRRSVLSESTNRHNNAADDAEADSDGDLCHKTDPERGETWFARWGELVDVLRAIDDDVAPDAFRGAARELLRCGVEIVDAADAEDGGARRARAPLRRRTGGAGLATPPFGDPLVRERLPAALRPAAGFQVDAIAALHERRDVLLAVRCGAGKACRRRWSRRLGPGALDAAQQVCVWTAPTQALVADKVDDLQGRYGEGWRNAGGRGDFAAAVAGLERAGARDDDGDVVFDYADAAASSSTSASTARHPVLAAISAKACDVAVLVMCPEMLAGARGVEAQGRTIQACFALAGAKAPVVALSGTLSKFEVGSLLEALGLPPAPATLVIRTASPINSMVDIHTGDGGDEDPDGYGAPCASPLDHVAVSPPAPVTQRPYYLTVTFTTVGYGDWTPKTDAGKGFAMAYARAAASGFPPTRARDPPPFRFVGVAFLLPVVLKLGEVVVAGLNKTVLSSLASRTHRPVWPQVVVSAVLLATPLVVGGESLLARTERHRRKHEGDLTFEKLCATRWDRMDAYWWAFATITTIGYGDLDTACLGDLYTPMTCYVLGSVVLVAAAIANLTAALKERGEDLEERRLLEAFDVDEIMALDLDGDGVSKAEFLLGMLSAMDAVDAAKLELYARRRAARSAKKKQGAAAPPAARDRGGAAADDDEATSLCPWWLRCDCTAADVVDDAGDVEDGGVEARGVGAASQRGVEPARAASARARVSARDVEPDACRVC
ncbi:potassium channel [Aureococcus anophagefferens]|nr:potassium channel [Aureococcus anophagefferens]